MPSPFPGMDPYLETPARWTDVHQSLITYIRDALQPQVRPHYHARLGERLYILTPPQTMYPDALITQQPLREAPATAERVATPAEASDTDVPDTGVSDTDVPDKDVADTDASEAADDTAPPLDEPFILTFLPDERREPFVEIVHTAGDEVVTIIEVLSPTNKAAGEGRRRYRQKQRAILNSAIHLVEIDLLSQGVPALALSSQAQEKVPPHRYLVCVRRAPERARCELYPIPLPERLPRLGVPLRAPDPDVGLDLGAVLTRCYDNGGYADLIDYRKPPPVPLSQEEAAWLDARLKEKGLRT